MNVRTVPVTFLSANVRPVRHPSLASGRAPRTTGTQTLTSAMEKTTMATTAGTLAPMRDRHARSREKLVFQLVFALTFLGFVAVALVQRLIPGRMRSVATVHTGRRSILGDAKALAYATIPLAFMG